MHHASSHLPRAGSPSLALLYVQQTKVLLAWVTRRLARV